MDTDHDNTNRLLKVSKETPFTVNEIINFMLLTGLPLPETIRFMHYLAKADFTHLGDVNRLVALGILDIDKIYSILAL